MEAKIISQHTLPDTYGEWWIEYLDNVIMPYFAEPLLVSPESAEKHRAKTKTMEKEIQAAKKHYNIDQPKINHVDLEVSMQL